jgi:hypothetical protein
MYRTDMHYKLVLYGIPTAEMNIRINTVFDQVTQHLPPDNCHNVVTTVAQSQVDLPPRNRNPPIKIASRYHRKPLDSARVYFLVFALIPNGRR